MPLSMEKSTEDYKIVLNSITGISWNGEIPVQLERTIYKMHFKPTVSYVVLRI
jgi:hypothetical protein